MAILRIFEGQMTIEMRRRFRNGALSFLQFAKYQMRFGYIWRKFHESNGNNRKEDALKSQSVIFSQEELTKQSFVWLIPDPWFNPRDGGGVKLEDIVVTL